MSPTHRIRPSALVVALAAALAAGLAARPCAARGTGGFLRDWLLCAPLEGTALGSPPLAPDFVPYPGLFALGTVWLPVEADEDGQVDLRRLFPSEPQAGTALLATFFEAPAAGVYTLRIGSDDAVRVEVDGHVVHSNDVRRGWSADQDTVRVPLERGWHRMLVRVVEYGGAWGVSVRVADDKDQPIDLPHQAAVPKALEAACRFDEGAVLEERAEVAVHLARKVADLLRDLEGIQQRLASAPEGYVTFTEYEGARNLGLRFFRSMAALWREASQDTWNEEDVHAAREAAAGAAQGFSDVLAEETRQVAAAIEDGRRIWEKLGGEELSRRELAADTLLVAGALERTRRLALGVEKDRLRMARLENDIRNWRQREFTLHVVDAEGVPVEDARVEVVQTRHDFLFGCNAFALGLWGNERQNRLYEERFLGLFNLAVVPVYWSTIEEQRGRPDFAAPDAIVRWAQAHGVQVKATPLVWREAVPRWVDDLPPDQARAALKDHVRRVVERYRDAVDFWDVVSQPAAEMKIGPATIEPADALRWAAGVEPRGRLMLNLDQPEAAGPIVERIAAKGSRVDALGLQAHQHEGIWPIDLLEHRIAQAAAARRPVQVSEVTLPGAEENEREQADAVRRLYTVAFASRDVAGVVWWDLSDRFAWRNAPAGLLRANLSRKPAYRALDHLINHLWRTDAAGRTGEDGKLTVRAFFGRHRVTVRTQDRETSAEVHLGQDGPATVEVVMPAGR